MQIGCGMVHWCLCSLQTPPYISYIQTFIHLDSTAKPPFSCCVPVCFWHPNPLVPLSCRQGPTLCGSLVLRCVCVCFILVTLCTTNWQVYRTQTSRVAQHLVSDVGLYIGWCRDPVGLTLHQPAALYQVCSLYKESTSLPSASNQQTLSQPLLTRSSSTMFVTFKLAELHWPRAYLCDTTILIRYQVNTEES